MPTIGVLALQGDFREHTEAVRRLGVEYLQVRKPEEVAAVDAIIIPGGESTAIGRLARLYGLVEPLRRRISEGVPTLGTCAGLILMAARLTAGDRELLGVLDVSVERNAFGRQNESFEAQLDVEGFADPFPAVFIRAPWIEKVGGGVDVLASVGDHPVMVRQDNLLACSFHPELTTDTRIHEMLKEMIG